MMLFVWKVVFFYIYRRFPMKIYMNLWIYWLVFISSIIVFFMWYFPLRLLYPIHTYNHVSSKSFKNISRYFKKRYICKEFIVHIMNQNVETYLKRFYCCHNPDRGWPMFFFESHLRCTTHLWLQSFNGYWQLRLPKPRFVWRKSNISYPLCRLRLYHKIVTKIDRVDLLHTDTCLKITQNTTSCNFYLIKSSY